MKFLTLIFFFSLSSKVMAMENIINFVSVNYKVINITKQVDVKFYKLDSEERTYKNYRNFNRYDLWIENLNKKLTFSPVFLAPAYEYSKELSSKDSILQITSYEFDHNEYGISPYLVLISEIPTNEWGLASYQLTLPLGVVNFKTFADRKKWAIREYFKSYVEIYKAKLNADEYFLIVIDEPNNFYQDNGLYLVLP